MTVRITGVSCVGKTAVGEALAKDLGVPFVDLDRAVERQLGEPISRLQQRYGTMARYREAAAGVLTDTLRSFDSREAVIALPPSGLMGPFRRHLKGRSVLTIALEDTAENILARIRFYDADSRPIQKSLTAREHAHYLREIRRDMAYFGRSYRKADARVVISGCSVDEAARRIREAMLKAASTPKPRISACPPTCCHLLLPRNEPIEGFVGVYLPQSRRGRQSSFQSLSGAIVENSSREHVWRSVQ